MNTRDLIKRIVDADVEHGIMSVYMATPSGALIRVESVAVQEMRDGGDTTHYLVVKPR